MPQEGARLRRTTQKGLITLLDIFTDAVLSIFIMAGVGVVIGHVFSLDPRPVRRLALYVFSPALIFSALSTAEIPLRDVLSVFFFLGAWVPPLYAVSWLIAWRMGFQARARNAFILT